MKTNTACFLVSFSVVIVFSLSVLTAQADTFGSGDNQFDIVFVDVGNANNPDDTTGSPNPAGKVEYAYRMGKFEISRDMVTKANNEGSLGITLDPMNVVTGGPRADMPATGVTWFEAATFVNWLNTSQGHQAAYNFDGNGNFQLWGSADAWQVSGENLFRHKDAVYFLPSVEEWYKAAYYDPASVTYFDYPTGSNTAPTAVSSGTELNSAVYLQPYSQGPSDITSAGGPSPFGTLGQGGNVFEWEETELDLENDSTTSSRGARGGFWYYVFFPAFDLQSTSRYNVGGPSSQSSSVGFRVASIPEPSTAMFGVLAVGGLYMRRRR